MTSQPNRARAGARIILTLAATVVLVAGMRAAATLLLPMLAAAFLAILCIPPMRRLRAMGLPDGLAIGVVVAGATLALIGVSAVIGRSVVAFQDQMPEYHARLSAMIESGTSWLTDLGIDVSGLNLAESFSSGALFDLVTDAAAQLLGALSNVMLVVLTMIFILLEARSLPDKVRRAVSDPEATLSQFSQAAEHVQKYLSIKTVISLITGVLVAILMWALGIDFPLLWGLVTFLFNFIPNIGSIISAVPPVLLALVQLGPIPAALAAVGQLAINLVLGNMVEPKLMGERLGMSTLVVFVSMVFWGWVWGAMGMLLSVPLTVIVKILLEHTTDMKWIAVLLGPASASPKAALAEPATTGTASPK